MINSLNDHIFQHTLKRSKVMRCMIYNDHCGDFVEPLLFNVINVSDVRISINRLAGIEKYSLLKLYNLYD